MSYDGQVNFGLIGDYDAMAELEDFAGDLDAALEELIDAGSGRLAEALRAGIRARAGRRAGQRARRGRGPRRRRRHPRLLARTLPLGGDPLPGARRIFQGSAQVRGLAVRGPQHALAPDGLVERARTRARSSSIKSSRRARSYSSPNRGRDSRDGSSTRSPRAASPQLRGLGGVRAARATDQQVGSVDAALLRPLAVVGADRSNRRLDLLGDLQRRRGQLRAVAVPVPVDVGRPAVEGRRRSGPVAPAGWFAGAPLPGPQRPSNSRCRPTSTPLSNSGAGSQYSRSTMALTESTAPASITFEMPRWPRGPVIVVGGDYQAAHAASVGLHAFQSCPVRAFRILAAPLSVVLYPRGDDGRVEAGPLHHRYVLVTALILATVTFDLAAPDGDGARTVAVVLGAATLVAAVVTSRVHPWVVRVTIAVCILLVAAAAGAVLGTEGLGGTRRA